MFLLLLHHLIILYYKKYIIQHLVVIYLSTPKFPFSVHFSVTKISPTLHPSAHLILLTNQSSILTNLHHQSITSPLLHQRQRPSSFPVTESPNQILIYSLLSLHLTKFSIPPISLILIFNQLISFPHPLILIINQINPLLPIIHLLDYNSVTFHTPIHHPDCNSDKSITTTHSTPLTLTIPPIKYHNRVSIYYYVFF